MAKYKSNNSKAVSAEVIFKSSQIVTLKKQVVNIRFLHLCWIFQIWVCPFGQLFCGMLHMKHFLINVCIPFSLCNPSSFRHYSLILYYIFSTSASVQTPLSLFGSSNNSRPLTLQEVT